MGFSLQIKRIQTDSGLVLGSYDPNTDTYRSLDRPCVLTHFVRTCVNDMFRPRSEHLCSPACAEVVTLCFGAPFHDDLISVAPPYVFTLLFYREISS